MLIRGLLFFFFKKRHSAIVLINAFAIVPHLGQITTRSSHSFRLTAIWGVIF